MAPNPARKLRVMLDSNVLVAGIIWKRFPREVVKHAITGDYQLVLTEYIIDEVREHVLRLRPGASAALEAMLADSHYELAPEPTLDEEMDNQNIVRDPEDIPIVLAAINAGVDFLVSQDKDITDPAQPVHERLKIILPGTFLREHMGWDSDALEKVRTAE